MLRDTKQMKQKSPRASFQTLLFEQEDDVQRRLKMAMATEICHHHNHALLMVRLERTSTVKHVVVERELNINRIRRILRKMLEWRRISN